jgi:hypothetical protein
MGQYESQRAKRSGGKTRKRLSVTTEAALNQTANLFGKELAEDDYKLWGRILSGVTDMAAEWAFEQWNRNGKFFPKPAEILEYTHAFGYSEQNQVQYCGSCRDGWTTLNPEASISDQQFRRCECVISAIAQSKIPIKICDRVCKAKHGTGYHWNDVYWLFKRLLKERATNPNANAEDFYEELDSKRQSGPPQWKVGGVAAQDWQSAPVADEEVPF